MEDWASVRECLRGAKLRFGDWRCPGIHRSPELLLQTEVIAVTPDLDDLARRPESEDVHARELGATSSRRKSGPHPGMRARGRPPRSDEVCFRDEKIDAPPQVRKCGTERFSDPGLPSSSRSCLSRAKIVAHVVVGEHLGGAVHVPRPHTSS
jgi:hypothetical protein